MTEPRRQAYLEAMGFDVWLARPEAPEALGLQCAQGEAGGKRILAVCERNDQADSRLADDISRALGDDLVWAWPGDSEQGEVSRLTTLIDERLFTEVVVFGKDLAKMLGCKAGARVVGSARMRLAASLDELAVSPVARRDLWEKVVRPAGR